MKRLHQWAGLVFGAAALVVLLQSPLMRADAKNSPLDDNKATPKQNKKLTPDEARKKFYQYWLEVERVTAGKVTKDPNDLCGYQFKPTEYAVWPRRGELSCGISPGIRLDPTTDPMRVEILSGSRYPATGAEVIQIGICRFEGENLILVLGPWQALVLPKPGEDYPSRPKEFRSTRENKYTLSVLQPSSLYGVD